MENSSFEHNENPFLDMSDVGDAEQLTNELRVKKQLSENELRKVLDDMLAALFMEGKVLTGDANDFHNFAVTLSKYKNDNKNAYLIVHEGLKIHSADTDLLADAIMYGYNAGFTAECKEWYNKLLTVDKKRWTWRAFSFTLTYLVSVYASPTENVVGVDQILQLARTYQTIHGDREEAWLATARVFEQLNQRNEALAVLKEADNKFVFCPKCWLRYADLMSDAGNYAEADRVIKKILCRPNSTEHVNMSYVHFLNGQCKMAMLLQSEEYQNGEIDEKIVRAIYRSFRLAKSFSERRESIDQRMNEYIERLKIETGIDE